MALPGISGSRIVTGLTMVQGILTRIATEPDTDTRADCLRAVDLQIQGTIDRIRSGELMRQAAGTITRRDFEDCIHYLKRP